MRLLLSALVDGELEQPLAERAISRLLRSAPWRRQWGVYHLIGDCLRQGGGVVVPRVFLPVPRVSGQPFRIGRQGAGMRHYCHH
ncbi:hypothetical protein AZSI13_08480 [Azospira sp. I13]|uniref:sigma-E factor negative regulatory protein n=1 Tax=Azospira sp. I13 TaxID=1765050 RepID=UPI000D4AAF52|nr:hypothetical protein AZSI13_08480 [Azospira sp. I13]